MKFVHDDQDFERLLAIIARETGISEVLIEKDYWVTHTLWALHETGLDIWFKGGTSLSKGFGLIQRFSEDLDLMILPGTVTGLPNVTSWTSTNKGPVSQRLAFYEALINALIVPAVRVQQDNSRIDSRGRGADYLGHYPGIRQQQLAPAMSPFVRLEVGHARVVPHVDMPLKSFVHDHLNNMNMMSDYKDNRPLSVRCVHPLVTLFEKLDAMARCYERETIEADSFVRHYEDMAQIVGNINNLPKIRMTAHELAQDMLASKDMRTLPNPDDSALNLKDGDKRAAIETAYARIAPMFWGDRMTLDEACSMIRSWLSRQAWNL
ncbi:MAG: nucleotidyl transferase AbiEii/AbiGii toxin family protein [Granulosicoccus sp.]